MNDTTIDSKVLSQLKAKAAKYDEIETFMESVYQYDEDGTPVDNEHDLCTIGEEICSIMGYL